MRYVKGSAYTDSTDFNIPNVEPSSDTQELQYDSNGYIVAVDDEMTIPIYIEETGNTEIRITYLDLSEEESDDASEIEAPAANLTGGNDDYYEFYEDSSAANTLSRKVNISSGNYILTISGLKGRNFTYSVITDKEDEIELVG